MNTVIDLTHTIREGMPVYPGTDSPTLEEATTVESDGFAEKKLTMFSHVGTHMDAPAHIFAGATTLDALDISKFTGSACVLDVSMQPVITREFLEQHSTRIATADFVLFSSGHERRWGTEAYFSPFPVLDEEGAVWIANQSLKGLGIDAISFDTMDAQTLPIHQILLSSGMVLIENLCNLEQMPADGSTFIALPLKIHESDGSPIRAIAMF